MSANALTMLRVVLDAAQVGIALVTIQKTVVPMIERAQKEGRDVTDADVAELRALIEAQRDRAIDAIERAEAMEKKS